MLLATSFVTALATLSFTSLVRWFVTARRGAFASSRIHARIHALTYPIVYRFACLTIGMCGAFTFAHAQTPALEARIDAPPGATLVRIRWPATTLARAATARLIALDDATGAPLPFSFVIAPQDQGHTVHPMWLIARLTGAAPYRLGVSGDDAHGQYRDDPDALAERRPPPLMDLPVATVPAEAWGPIIAVLEEAQTTQQSRDTHWLGGILALVAAALVALTVFIGFFVRAQTRCDDVTRL
ncbi:MAG: hypothetical protein ACRYHA_10385 [Janthinobacterium lividum]